MFRHLAVAVAVAASMAPAPASSASALGTVGAASAGTRALSVADVPAPTGLRADRLPGGGVELRWDPFVGDAAFVAYRVHRYVSGTETVTDTTEGVMFPRFAETAAPAAATYRVSTVTVDGSGPLSAELTPGLIDDALLVSGTAGGTTQLRTGALGVPDGQLLVDLPTRSGQRPVSEGWALSPDGREVISTRHSTTTSGGVLWRESVSGEGAPTPVVTTAQPVDGRPSWSPDGLRYALSTSEPPYNHRTLRVGTLGGVELFALPGYTEVAWHPDGRTLIARAPVADRELELIDGVTGERLGTVPGTRGATMPTVSPDGRWIAHAHLDTTDWDWEVRLVPIEGGTPQTVETPVTSVLDLTWNLSGTTLAMSLNLQGFRSIRTIAVGQNGVEGEVANPYADLGIAPLRATWVGNRVSIGPSASVGTSAPLLALDTSSVPGATVSCSVDDGPAVPCSGTFKPAVTAAGTHLVRVRAVEPDGRVTVAARAYTIGQARPSLFRAISPARVLDTRSGNGAPAAAVAAYSSVRFKVTGRGGVPSSGVSAVVLNVTVTQPQRSGFLTAHAGGTARPSASNLNFVAGQTVPNLVVVPVGADGTVSVANRSAGTVHVVADVTGAHTVTHRASPGSFGALTPARVLDTRSVNGAPAAAVAAYSSVRFKVTGRGGVPSSGVSAVVLNVTVTQPQRSGFLTAHAGGTARPSASNLNFVAGQTVPNLVVVPVGADGTVSVANRSAGTVHVVADVFGSFVAGAPKEAGTYGALAPARVLDTRVGNGAPAVPVAATSAVRVQVTGRGGVPSSGVSAVVLNVTVTQPQRSGFLTAHAGGTARPSASNLNFVAGQTVPNLVVVPVAADGTVSFSNGSSGSVHVVADVFGWFRSG